MAILSNNKFQKLQDVFNKKNMQAIILTDGYNIHYLSGYTGHTGCMLVTNKEIYILTDSRYTEQVTIEAPDVICIDIAADGYSKKFLEILKKCFKIDESIDDKINIGFENLHISYSQYKAFNDELNKFCKLIPLEESVNSLRMIKNKDEIDNIRMAEHIGDEAFNHILTYIEEGMTEREIALELEVHMRRLGAQGLSFDTIVASGNNSSLPHATPTNRKIQKGDFITMDFGCVYNGYCSDMTRTLIMGEEITDKQMEIYQVVYKAQLSALKMIRPGVKCSDVDKCARDIIEKAGYGQYFGHGLGHSVGLYIHEEPRLSKKCDIILEEGMTVTVEPGIYIPGEFGVRIEDLVVVTKDGYENLTNCTKALIML